MDMIPVGSGAFLAIAAAAERGGDCIAQVGLLADLIDRTGRRGAAGIGAGRAFHHFHLLDVEQVAGNGAKIARAIEKDAAGGVESAHVNRIACGGIAVLAGIERTHAGTVAQCFGQRGGALLLKQLTANHLDGLRRVLKALGELGRCHHAAHAAHLDLVQRGGGNPAVYGGCSIGVGLGAGVSHGRQREHQAGSQRGGRQQAALWNVFAARDVTHREHPRVVLKCGNTTTRAGRGVGWCRNGEKLRCAVQGSGTGIDEAAAARRGLKRAAAPDSDRPRRCGDRMRYR